MTRRPDETSCLGRFVQFYFLNPVFWDQFPVTLCFSVKLELDPFARHFPPSGVVVLLLGAHRTSTGSGGIFAFVKMILLKNPALPSYTECFSDKSSSMTAEWMKSDLSADKTLFTSKQ